jgi:hypothetical protein
MIATGSQMQLCPSFLQPSRFFADAQFPYATHLQLFCFFVYPELSWLQLDARKIPLLDSTVCTACLEVLKFIYVANELYPRASQSLRIKGMKTGNT